MGGIHIVELVKTCDSCPAQWDAKDSDGRSLYIRYRGGLLTVQRAPPDDIHNPHAGHALWLVKKKIGDEFDGCMDEDELAKHTKRILRFGDAADDEDDPIDPEIVDLVLNHGLTKDEVCLALRVSIQEKLQRAPKPWPNGEPF